MGRLDLFLVSIGGVGAYIRLTDLCSSIVTAVQIILIVLYYVCDAVGYV
jgi:hypothetical protein